MPLLLYSMCCPTYHSAHSFNAFVVYRQHVSLLSLSSPAAAKQNFVLTKQNFDRPAYCIESVCCLFYCLLPAVLSGFALLCRASCLTFARVCIVVASSSVSQYHIRTQVFIACKTCDFKVLADLIHLASMTLVKKKNGTETTSHAASSENNDKT